MTKTLTSLAVLVALLGALLAAPLAARAQDGAANGIPTVPVEASNKSGNKTFAGEWNATQIVEQGGAFFAEGVLTGEVKNKQGKTTHTVEETVLLPLSVASDATASAGVRAQAATCEVLNLVLGPITLNLLGLNLFIGGEGGVPIVIDLTADPSGGLLGQLLCGLAGGIPVPLQQLTDFLNALNTLLGLLG